MKRFDSVRSMRVAVASLSETQERLAPDVTARAELAAWVARRRVARGVSGELVSASAPQTALSAWRAEQAKRVG